MDPMNEELNEDELDDVDHQAEDSDEHRESLPQNLKQTPELAIKSGFLNKRGEKNRIWKRKWFVLRPTKLAYYKDDREYELLNLIPIDQVHAADVVPLRKREFVFTIITRSRSYLVQASSQEECDAWIKSIRTLINDKENSAVEPTSPMVRAMTASSATGSVLTESSIPVSLSSKTAEAGSPVMPRIIARRPEVGFSHDTRSPLVKSWTENDQSDSEEETPTNAMPYVPAAGDDIVHAQGYLYKLKTGIANVKSWKRFWFVLRNGRLTYYKDQTEYEAKKLVPLESVIDILEVDAPIPKARIQTFCFKIVLPKHSWILSAETYEEQKLWLEKLKMIHEISRTS